MFYVYFLKSLKNNKIYTGYTSKLPAERLIEHNQHSNVFTSQNGPFELVYYETYHCKRDAMLRENFYKMGFGKQIKEIIVKYTETISLES